MLEQQSIGFGFCLRRVKKSRKLKTKNTTREGRNKQKKRKKGGKKQMPKTKSSQSRVKKMILFEKRLDLKKKRDIESYKTKAETAKDLGVKDVAAQKFIQQQTIHVETNPGADMFLSYNNAIKPPFHIWLDTNFINFSMQNKIEIVEGLMDCLLAKVVPCVCDCVMGELEKLGKKFRIALRIAKDKRFQRLKCDNKYADDCVVSTVTRNPIYIVGTCDQDLKRRLRQIPGVPIMYIQSHRYTVERLPEAYGAPR